MASLSSPPWLSPESPRRSSPVHPLKSSDAPDSEIGKMKDKLVTIAERFLCNLIPEEKRETNLAGIDKYYFVTWALQAMNVGVVVQGNLTIVYRELFNAVHLPPIEGPPPPPPLPPSAGGPPAPPADEATPAPPAD
ncbi:hypothetical protein Ancab_038077 [Ancistrocladus abbreviatus]